MVMLMENVDGVVLLLACFMALGMALAWIDRDGK